jgi:hypothetical protein
MYTPGCLSISEARMTDEQGESLRNREREGSRVTLSVVRYRIRAPAMSDQGEPHQREYFYVAHMIYGQCRLQGIRWERLGIHPRRIAGHVAASHPSGARSCKYVITV